jgi:hypothetical protein
MRFEFGNLKFLLCTQPKMAARLRAASGLSQSDLLAASCGFRELTASQCEAMASVVCDDESWLFKFTTPRHRGGRMEVR